MLGSYSVQFGSEEMAMKVSPLSDVTVTHSGRLEGASHAVEVLGSVGDVESVGNVASLSVSLCIMYTLS